jgi:predicted MPP superfamily phosphohydrolase
MSEIDFSQRRSFPGTHGNRFDAILHAAEIIQRIPSLLFALLLGLLALVATRIDWPFSLGLWAFFLIDWALLASLPRFGKSYGPAKPPLLVLALLRSLAALLPLALALPAQLLGTLLVIVAFWVEPHRITLTRQILATSKLNDDSVIKILHLGDLHIERITARERQLVDLVKSTQPDLILFSGDILNLSYLKDPIAWQAARDIMREWIAPSGVYAVKGSPAVDLPDVFPTLLEGLAVHWLNDEKVSLMIKGQEFDLIGLNCSHKPFVDGPKLLPLASSANSRFTILLYHSPDLAPIAARAGIDLELCGHTHGGQVRLPFFGALFTGSLYGKRYETGRIPVDKMTLYVSRGIGMEGASAPRVRFLCPPEVILWEIKGLGYPHSQEKR